MTFVTIGTAIAGCTGDATPSGGAQSVQMSPTEMQFDLEVETTNVAVGEPIDLRVVPLAPYAGGVSTISFSCRKLGSGIEAPDKLLLESRSAYDVSAYLYFDGLNTRQSSHPRSLKHRDDFIKSHTFRCSGKEPGLFMIHATLYVHEDERSTTVEAEPIVVLVTSMEPK